MYIWNGDYSYMAIYHFSGQVMSRISKKTGKPKSPLACAAYRSGEKLVDEMDNQSFYYKREVEPVTHILIPSNAPKWALNRERLWNEVNKIEKNYNAQFAREFNVALPVELTKEQQEKLTLEFCQEAFVNRGMVADIAIHRDDKENPHFHVMLTVRPFEEDGTWGVKAKREYKFDEQGNHILDKNGKKAFYKVETTDWNKRETFNFWRKLWADKTNLYLKENGISENISHLSHEDRGVEELPTIHEGYVARKLVKSGMESDRVNHNKEVKKHNAIVKDIQKYKKKKEQIIYQNKFSRKFSPMEKKHLSDIAKHLKMFVNYKNINERKQQLNKWKKSIQFSKDSETKLKQLNRIDNETELINQAEEILSKESERFIREYYPERDINSLLEEEKSAIVEETLKEGRLLSKEKIEMLTKEVYADKIESEITNIIKNRFAFVMSLDEKMLQLDKRRREIEKETKLHNNPGSFEEKLLHAAKKHPKKIYELKHLVGGINELYKAKDLIEELYDLELNKIYSNKNYKHFSLEQKETLVVGYEYYKQPINLDDNHSLRRYTNLEQEDIIQRYMQCKESGNWYEFKKLYPDFQTDNPRYLLFFKDECLKNSNLSHIATKKLKEIDPEKVSTIEFNKTDTIKKINSIMNDHLDENTTNLSSGLPAVPSYVIDRFLSSMMQTREQSTKAQFEEDLKRKRYKKKKKHRGHSL